MEYSLGFVNIHADLGMEHLFSYKGSPLLNDPVILQIVLFLAHAQGGFWAAKNIIRTGNPAVNIIKANMEISMHWYFPSSPTYFKISSRSLTFIGSTGPLSTVRSISSFLSILSNYL